MFIIDAVASCYSDLLAAKKAQIIIPTALDSWYEILYLAVIRHDAFHYYQISPLWTHLSRTLFQEGFGSFRCNFVTMSHAARSF